MSNIFQLECMKNILSAILSNEYQYFDLKQLHLVYVINDDTHYNKIGINWKNIKLTRQNFHLSKNFNFRNIIEKSNYEFYKSQKTIDITKIVMNENFEIKTTNICNFYLIISERRGARKDK